MKMNTKTFRLNVMISVGMVLGQNIHYLPTLLNVCVDMCELESMSMIQCIAVCSLSLGCEGVILNQGNKTCCGCSAVGVPEQNPSSGNMLYRTTNKTCTTTDLVEDVHDSLITASSVYLDNDPTRGRLNTLGSGIPTRRGAWLPASKTPYIEYIQVRFLDIKEIFEIGTQGRNGYLRTQCVTSYQVSYSIDCVTFSIIKNSAGTSMVYPGNNDPDTIVWNTLSESILAVCVRISPITFMDHPSMRFGVKGCSFSS